ncbi:MAG: class I SAM-dependent methyltransferase [bacterium]
MVQLSLKSSKQKDLLRHHPWIFSGALAEIPTNIAPGETVELLSKNGSWYGRGAFSPHSQISVRIWTFIKGQMIDSAFFKTRLQQSIYRRRQFLQGCSTTAMRLVNSESDGLPGLIVDRYNDFLVIQCLAAGVEFWKREIIENLNELVPNTGIFERSDSNIRLKEGLHPVNQLLSGQQPPDLLEIREERIKLLVDIVKGHKTGFYLDQRENRQEILPYVSGGTVLNCFSYSGGFTLNALAGGARHVTNIDESQTALDLLKKNIVLNGHDLSVCNSICGDAFQVLRHLVDQKCRYDLIILDPPKFADSPSRLTGALKGYNDINRLAFRLLKTGGLLFTFSCSGSLDPDRFQEIVADAALEAGRSVQLLKRLGPAKDHPVLLSFPEGNYLKGLVCRAD